MTERQHAALRAHLFPADGCEAAAIALCGSLTPTDLNREAGVPTVALSVHRIVPVPYEACSVRTRDRVTWSTDVMIPWLENASRLSLSILKIHSHPNAFEQFSSLDDDSDRELFPSIAGWIDHASPHASAVMLPDGRVFARTVDSEGRFRSIESVSVTGTEIRIWHADEFFDIRQRNASRSDGGVEVPEFAERTSQAFGKGTVAKLQRLRAAVIGASGTGSFVIEMTARLGMAEVVAADDDRVEVRNLNRIINATGNDAETHQLKVDVAARSVRAMGLPTRFVPLADGLWHPGVIRRVAECDVIFGCMDSIDGRDLLNRLAAYYCIPYFDIGVRLDADGRGGVDQICGSVNYLQPDGSSLVSRGVFTPEDVRAAVLRRTDPEAYREQVRAHYIRGVLEERPAVISINAFFASLAVNEFLARIHGYRDDGNSAFATFGMSFTQARLVSEPDGEPCVALARHVGRGDVRPLLGVPELSVRPSIDQ